MKVWLLTNTPSPYQVEFLRAIHQDGRCQLDVRFMGRGHRGSDPLQDDNAGFPYRVMMGTLPEPVRNELRLHPRAIWECMTGGHDLFVLSGLYTSPTFLICSWVLTLRRKNWAMWLERPWPEDYRPRWATKASAKNSFIRGIRHGLVGSLIRRAHGIMCIGAAAVDDYKARGADPGKLLSVPYHCDTTRFVEVTPEQTSVVRDSLELGEKTVFLFSGLLIERKGADVAIAAFGKLAEERSDIALIIMGDGPESDDLQKDCPAGIHFVGNIDQCDIPAYFAAADVFVFPSRHDGWAVVLNEACAAGLPVITTNAVGAAEDLIEDGVSGCIVPRDDPDAITEAMRLFCDSKDCIMNFGRAARAKAEMFTLKQGVERFTAAAQRFSSEGKV